MKEYKIDHLEWWHTVPFPNGQLTKGRTNYEIDNKADRFLLPKKITNKTVLDFGAFDGYWSIKAKQRGAEYVVATDRWDPPLETAKLALEAWDIPYVYSGNLDEPLNIDFGGQFDIVLFYGILYHLKNPFMGLWNAKKYCKPGGLIIIETAIDQGVIASIKEQTPLLWMANKPYNNDPSNYCVPNELGMIQMAKNLELEVLSKDRTLHTRFSLLCRKI
jgi:tRNA (mo5U34)-methyltransferase